MRSEWQDIRLLHGLLKHSDRWYISISGMYFKFNVRAMCYARQRLKKMSCLALYWRYKKWEKSNSIITREYYYSFLDDVIHSLGRKTLRGIDRDIFDDNVLLTIKFL